jgi:hypothetical protein
MCLSMYLSMFHSMYPPTSLEALLGKGFPKVGCTNRKINIKNTHSAALSPLYRGGSAAKPVNRSSPQHRDF